MCIPPQSQTEWDKQTHVVALIYVKTDLEGKCLNIFIPTILKSRDNHIKYTNVVLDNVIPLIRDYVVRDTVGVSEIRDVL